MTDADPPVVDESVLAEVLESTGNDMDFVRELIETYLADSPAQLEAMAEAVTAEDAASLVRPAHTLKSSSATLGAMRLSAVARELEIAGRSGVLEPSAKGQLETAHAEWESARQALATWMQGASAE